MASNLLKKAIILSLITLASTHLLASVSWSQQERMIQVFLDHPGLYNKIDSDVDVSSASSLLKDALNEYEQRKVYRDSYTLTDIYLDLDIEQWKKACEYNPVTSAFCLEYRDMHEFGDRFKHIIAPMECSDLDLNLRACGFWILSGSTNKYKKLHKFSLITEKGSNKPLSTVVTRRKSFQSLEFGNNVLGLRVKILNSYLKSLSALEKLSLEVKKYKELTAVQDNPLFSMRVDKILDTLECISSDSTKAKIKIRTRSLNECPFDDGIAYTDDKKGSDITICKDLPEDRFASGLIHEFSHHCGTKDFHYYSENEPSKKDIKSRSFDQDALNEHAEEFKPLMAEFAEKNKHLSQNDFQKAVSDYFVELLRSNNNLKYQDISYLNADNYRLWIEKGFCLPEFDCSN